MQRREETLWQNERKGPRGFRPQGERGGAVQAVGDVLADLLAQYRRRFPELNVMVVETRAEALQ